MNAQSQLLYQQGNDSGVRQGTMRAAVLEAPRRWRIQEFPQPVPEADEVLIRMEGCGVCASGLPVWQGREWFEYPLPPGVPGHEGWGRIIGRGAAVDEAALPDGTRVAFLSDGAYATHVCLAAQKILVLPEELESDPFPAEPVGCAINILARSAVVPGQKVIIVGFGFLGSLLLQLLHDHKCRVAVVSRRDFSLQIAGELGAELTVSLDEPWKVKETLERSGWGSAPRVIEAVGNQLALDVASDLVDEGGRLIIAGYHQDDLRQVNLQSWNWRGIDVINAHERDPEKYMEGMRAGIRETAEQRLHLGSLLTNHYTLQEINKAYEDLQNRPDGFIKGWIDLKN